MARARTVERCLAAQRRTGRQLVFALGTALDLQGIERPRYPHGSGLADGLYAEYDACMAEVDFTVAAAAVLTGRCPRGAPILVQLPGGTLEVCVQRDDTVLLTGDAAATFSGTVLIQPCKAPRGVV